MYIGKLELLDGVKTRRESRKSLAVSIVVQNTVVKWELLGLDVAIASSLSPLKSCGRIADLIEIIFRPAIIYQRLKFPSVACFLFALLLMLTQYKNGIHSLQFGHGSAVKGGCNRGFCGDSKSLSSSMKSQTVKLGFCPLRPVVLFYSFDGRLVFAPEKSLTRTDQDRIPEASPALRMHSHNVSTALGGDLDPH